MHSHLHIESIASNSLRFISDGRLVSTEGDQAMTGIHRANVELATHTTQLAGKAPSLILRYHDVERIYI